MRQPVLFATAILSGAFLLCSAGRADESPGPAAQTDTAELDAKLAKLEEQLSAALRQVQQLRQALEAPRITTVLFLKFAKASVAAKLIAESPAGRDEVLVAADERLNAVVVHADAARTKQITKQLSTIDTPRN